MTFYSWNSYLLLQGTARRKKKVVHKTAATDDKKLQSNLKKLSVTNIPGIEEVPYECLSLSSNHTSVHKFMIPTL